MIIGALESQQEARQEDAMNASCVANARPLKPQKTLDQKSC
jgi:hypothetical protein